MRLSGALDNDVLVVTRKLLAEGVPAEPEALWTALHRSNSSLKRRPKRVLLSTLERVLDFLGLPDRPDGDLVPDRPDDDDDDDDDDSEAEMDYKTQDSAPVQAMNRSLRANLAPTPTPGPPPGSSAEDLPADERRRRQQQRMANGEPLPKRAKTMDQSGPAPPPPTDVSLSDLGGIDPIIDQLSNLLIRPLLCPHVYARMHVALPKGILLHGPPGCGKTLIARAFAASLALPFVEILGPSIVSGMSGESEKGVRDRFEEAKRNAPCLLFLDEIDAIAPKRETSQSGMEKRIVTQLLVSMDELDRDPSRPVIVLATTNRPDSLDPALRRGGRFDTEINIPVPNEHVRERILRAQTRHTPVADDVDFPELAKRTAGSFFERLERPGPDPGDPAPPTTAAQRAERRIVDLRTHDLAALDYDPISMAAFAATLPTIVPSSKREGFATIPDVSWDDIGALQR
ncbi:putative AAA domain-containing protein, partial [Teratosphaeria destructans]